MQRAGAATAVDVGAVLGEQRDHLGERLAHGGVECGLGERIFCVHISTLRQEQFHHLGAVFVHRSKQGRFLAFAAGDLVVGTVGQQQCHHLGVAAAGSEVQRGDFLGIL